MVSLMSILFLGFFLGMRHALDPDHVIAITTIVSRQKATIRAALIGVLWGIGHTFTILVVGAAIILFNLAIPARLGLSMELAVGAMLILLGILNLTGVLQWAHNRYTGHDHSNPDELITRVEDPAPNPGPVGSAVRALGLYNILRPLFVGIVHGLAGSAAVALLVMTTIKDPRWALAYLLIFGFGTIAGMMIITAAISTPFVHTARKFSNWNRRMAVASGLLSLGFGLFVSYQIGFVDGLFTAHPTWTPR